MEETFTFFSFIWSIHFLSFVPEYDLFLFSECCALTISSFLLGSTEVTKSNMLFENK